MRPSVIMLAVIAFAGLDFFLVSQHSPFAPYWPWLQ